MDAEYTNAALDDIVSDFGYDNTDQLTSTDHDAADQGDETYTYDDAGNRTISGYSTTTGNRLASDGTFIFTYDNEGNRLTRTPGATGEK